MQFLFVALKESDVGHGSADSRNSCSSPEGRHSSQQTSGDESHPENFILVDHALSDLFRKPATRHAPERKLSVVSADGSRWAAPCAALYGLHYQQLKPEYSDERHSLTNDLPCDAFANLALHFSRHALKSWLDVTGHKLDLNLSWGENLAAKIVLVESLLEDLCLFWNLRSANDCQRPAPIIPLPIDDAADERVLVVLRDWVLSLAEYGMRSNYCLVTSQTVDEIDCCRFAARLEKMLAETPTRYVDYEPPRKRTSGARSLRFRCDLAGTSERSQAHFHATSP